MSWNMWIKPWNLWRFRSSDTHPGAKILRLWLKTKPNCFNGIFASFMSCLIYGGVWIELPWKNKPWYCLQFEVVQIRFRKDHWWPRVAGFRWKGPISGNALGFVPCLSRIYFPANSCKLILWCTSFRFLSAEMSYYSCGNREHIFRASGKLFLVFFFRLSKHKVTIYVFC